MRYRITRDTEWHDGEETIIVLAGELVEVVGINEIPPDDGRWNIAQGIRLYAKQGREFVAISIRDWFGLIDRTWLELQATGPSPQLGKSKRKCLAVPVLRGQHSAPCATD